MRHSVRTMLVAMAIGVSICGLLPSEPRAQDRTDARFDLSALQGICTSVRARNSTRYEQQLQSAAGVRPDFDSESEARAKISALFASNMPICEGFNVGRGSVLKYAVAARASDFLYAAANIWNVDLNRPVLLGAGGHRRLVVASHGRVSNNRAGASKGRDPDALGRGRRGCSAEQGAPPT